MKTFKIFITMAFVIFATESFAALVGLTPNFPDISLSSQIVEFDHSNGPGGGSGVLTITDDNSVAGTASTMFFNADGSSFEGFFVDYSLSANFDGAGNFTSGSLIITYVAGTIASLGALTNGDVLLTADLVDFGFAGSGSAGVFDFVYDNISGVVAELFLGGIGPIAGSGLEGTIATISGAFGLPAVWDQTIFTSDFSATAFSNNFVPLPGALVLFGSALLGLFTYRRTSTA